jgi:hypothetical protein
MQGKNKRNGVEIIYWYKFCKLCYNKKAIIKNKKYKQKNRKKLADAQKIYHQNHKESDAATKKKWYEDNKEYATDKNQKYYESNKDDINTQRRQHRQDNLEDMRASDREYNKDHKEQRKQYRKKELAKIKNDPVLRLRKRISKSIVYGLKINGSAKNNKSMTQYLPYTMQELKAHLEKQFEPWMTWDNYGTYRVDIWDDGDPTTWTWQIDHIIPHSKFQYTSMEDQTFKDCWALTNLRPYSAKQNVIDGDRNEHQVWKT